MEIEYPKDNLRLKKQIIQRFQQTGFTLRPQALSAIIEYANFEQILHNVKFLFKNLNILDQNHIQEAIGLPQNNQSSNMNELLNQKLKESLIVLNSISDHRQIQLKESKFSYQSKSRSHFGEAKDLIDLSLKKFLIIKEKLKKDKNYSFSFTNDFDQKIKISDIGTLQPGRELKILFGIIVEKEKNIFYLQDQFSKVQLDLSQCQPSDGYINSQFVVMVEGYMNTYFVVKKLILPPRYSKKQIKDYFGDIDNFGAQDKLKKYIIQFSVFGQIIQNKAENINLKENENKLKKISLEQQKHFQIFESIDSNFDQTTRPIILISNFNIQDQKVLKNFRNILSQVQNQIPLAFILIGEFSTQSFIKDQQEHNQYLQNFNTFIEILDEFKQLAQSSYWIFVPGLNDLGLNVLPQKSCVFPIAILEKLESKLPYFINTSNPCRLSLFGKQILICRNDYMIEIRKNSIVPSSSKFSMNQHLILSILSQMSLYSPNFYTNPVSWQFADSLLFNEEPDFLILADSFSSNNVQELDKLVVVNPGNFCKTQMFSKIYLNTRQVEKLSC